ncbi:MAG: hypothetical protein JKY25_08710 [Robiginitomaculum sp.]|nr:hypothetical protein [Robiginitomaculum sp.]
MIRPHNNSHRHAICLDGIWQCRADPQEIGQKEKWRDGLSGTLSIAVPGSWNEQLAETGLLNYTGTLWYQRDIFIPGFAHEQELILYFGAADYNAQIFIDGKLAGSSGPQKLPFEMNITKLAAPGQSVNLVIKMDAQLPEHGPMQRVTRDDYVAEKRDRDEYWPAVRFDFFPFGGLNRSVYLCLLPKQRIVEAQIDTGWSDKGGTLLVKTKHTTGKVSCYLDGLPVGEAFASGENFALDLVDVQPWSPEDPKLYDLKLVLKDAHGNALDTVTKKIGFRSVSIQGEQFILNGKPIQLKGFGKHEDTPVSGRGVNLPMLVKDFQLLKWIGANSVRTSHYPYDETFLDMADEQGILVISEIFSINLDFRRTDERDLLAHKQSAEALIARDRSHACVIAWSLSNEPGYLGEAVYTERSAPYWEALFAHVRTIDNSRPLTVANVHFAGLDDPALIHSDFVTINRYFGWYSEPGQLDRAEASLRNIFDELQRRYAKPIFVSEFGADAVAGMHATTDQMWTEEYQADLIARYWKVMEQHPACIGGHVWNFADFRTAQHSRRVVMNHKGVFTRARDPKRAAFTLQELWRDDPSPRRDNKN